MSTIANTGVVLSAVLDEVVVFVRRYVGLTPEQADAIALWVAHAWVISEWRITPYLFVTAPDLGCGKTLLGEEVVGMLVRKALKAATATPSALIRSLGDEQTTLIYDEIDGVFARGNREDDSASELRTVFNAGNKRGAPALKCSGPGHEVREFNVFGPKVLIGIGDSLPPATLSRCIRVRMERLGAGESVADFDEEDAWNEAQPIVDQFQAWSEWITDAGRLRVKLARDVFPVRNRERDKWRPLFTIAHEAGGDWPARVHAACISLEGHGAESSYPVKVLTAAWRAFGDDEALTTNELLVRMAERDESGPWASWVETDRDGTTISTRSGESKLGRALRHFGESETLIRAERLPQAGRKRGYLRADLQPHAARYVSEVVQVVPDRIIEPETCDAKLSQASTEGASAVGDFLPNQALTEPGDNMDNYGRSPDSRENASGSNLGSGKELHVHTEQDPEGRQLGLLDGGL